MVQDHGAVDAVRAGLVLLRTQGPDWSTAVTEAHRAVDTEQLPEVGQLVRVVEADYTVTAVVHELHGSELVPRIYAERQVR